MQPFIKEAILTDKLKLTLQFRKRDKTTVFIIYQRIDEGIFKKATNAATTKEA